MKFGRKLWLAVTVLAVMTMTAAPLVGGPTFDMSLTALLDSAPLGGTTPLLVEVEPFLIGSAGDLHATSPDGATHFLGSFKIRSDRFVLTAPVPTELGEPGEVVTYFFTAAEAQSAGTPVQLSKGGQGTDEPPIWD